MEYHFGRLLDHVHLVVRDLEKSKEFYKAVLSALGKGISGEGEGYFFADEMFFTQGTERNSLIHLAFQSADKETVEAFYNAGLKAGGKDNGKPGERHYHPGYYAAYLLDPDGNNIEAVFHGPASRSADSVVVTPDS